MNLYPSVSMHAFALSFSADPMGRSPWGIPPAKRPLQAGAGTC